MTREKYERASEILDSIHHYNDLLDLLENSRDHYLSATKSSFSHDIMNILPITEDEPIIQEFIKVVQSKISCLEIEFQRL